MRGYVRKRGNKWSYTIDVGKDPITGKRKQKTKGGFDSPKEAESALNETIYELNKGLYIEPQKLTVKDFVLDWFDIYKHNLRGTTAEKYDSKIRTWIIPVLGHFKIQELKPAHGLMFSKKLLEKLKPNTARKVMGITKMIFNYAVEQDIIAKNPISKILIKEQKKKDMVTWNFDELNHFLSIAKKYDEFYYRIFAVAAFTGLRKGEVLALTESSVVEEKRIKEEKIETVYKLIIRQSAKETKEEGVFIGELKTHSSERQISIDSFTHTILKEQIHLNNKYQTKLGKMYEDHGLIFCHPDGKSFRPTYINKPFRKYIKISGVPYIRFHDLRHTHATLMLEMKANPKVVSERLGHSDVNMTLNIYTHPTFDMQEEAVNTFSDKVKIVVGGQNVVNFSKQ